MLYMPIGSYNASATISGADLCGGIITFSTGSLTCTFPTEKVIFDTMKDPVVGSGFRLLIYKYTSGDLTLTTANLPNYKGIATIVSTNAWYFYFVVTDATPAAPHFMVRSSRTNLLS